MSKRARFLCHSPWISGGEGPWRATDSAAKRFGHWTTLTLRAALLSSVALFSLPQSVQAQQQASAILRGSDGAPIPVNDPSVETQLRGGLAEGPIAEPSTDPVTYQQEPEYQRGVSHSGMRSSFAYLVDNTVPELLFRGTTDAVADRDVTYTLPNYGSLRNSMMHRANARTGLRGGKASVGDTVAAALRGSYTARAQMERANIDRARMHGAFAAFLPKVNGQFQVGRTGADSERAIKSVQENVATAGVELTMPLFTSGVNINNYRRAEHLSLASDYTFIAEEHRVALQAIASHINLRLNRKIEKTLRGNLSSMQQIAVAARSLYAAGSASRTDIAIADANVENARAELDLARRSQEEVRADYESLTGKVAPKKLAVGNISRIVPSSLEQAVDTALQFNPTLASAAHTARAGRHAAKAERGRFGPQVNLYGTYQKDLYSSLEDNREEDWTVGVRLTVPLFDMTLAPSVAAARHQALESEYRALDQGRLVERQVERQWIAFNSAKRRTGIVQKQVVALKQSVTGARKEYEAGYRSITDVLTDQVQLARARITLETARHERMLAAYQLVFTTADPALRNLPAMQELASLR